MTTTGDDYKWMNVISYLYEKGLLADKDDAFICELEAGLHRIIIGRPNEESRRGIAEMLRNDGKSFER